MSVSSAVHLTDTQCRSVEILEYYFVILNFIHYTVLNEKHKSGHKGGFGNTWDGYIAACPKVQILRQEISFPDWNSNQDHSKQRTGIAALWAIAVRPE